MQHHLPEMIKPVTLGFDHINLDVSFTYLDRFDLFQSEDYAACIDICNMWELKSSMYLLRGKLAFLLNSRKSRNAKAMNMFTEITTKTKSEYQDKTESKKGMFGFFNFGKKRG